jgi:hypothetical protein
VSGYDFPVAYNYTPNQKDKFYIFFLLFIIAYVQELFLQHASQVIIYKFLNQKDIKKRRRR